MTQLREGATKNVDFGVAKAFDVSERFKAHFRADFLNAFNHPTFGGFYYGGWGSILICASIAVAWGRSTGPATIRETSNSV